MYSKEIELKVRELTDLGRFIQEKNAMQHGDWSVYEHSIRVCTLSCMIAHYLTTVKFINVDFNSLIVGSLLHDYFLYDWHEKGDGSHRFHGFRHPAAALFNAEKDYDLNDTQRDIILHHMFPLTVIPPATLEGWIVCVADKICASAEVFTKKGSHSNVS
ncbi:MAG: HD domain-containing protein [Lachnospiraceae bacterium]|jgi:uncharacterized protein|nr:HD domain-containing protein [Lachnospiraceae bacterium]MEE3460855.1 HD domain-containing protein [Lachnospiraceae bacterium]